MKVTKSVLRESAKVQYAVKLCKRICGLWNLRYANKKLEKDPKEALAFLNSVHPYPKNIMVSVPLKKERSIDLSIIVPAHNVEKYIRQCMESILEQKTSYSYEVIVVENASSDKTWEIVRSYEKDGRVKVLRSQEPDPSRARNIGLRESSGKYLMFVDSDDYLLPDTLEKMMENILKHQADIVVCGYKKLEDGRFYDYPAAKEKKVWGTCEDMLHVDGFAWGKVYRWELFQDVCFPEWLWYEDSIIHMEIFPRASKMVVLPEYGYVYRRNTGSITASHDSTERCLDTLWVMRAIIRKRKELGLECDEIIYGEYLKHFTDISWLRIRRQPAEVKEAFFCAASYYMARERRNVDIDSLSPELKKIDRIFAGRREKMWESYCKYGYLI
ncbi:MAG: glycosyltransferase family 2 protein [Eubacteriales bacterium]|nr:glycosyltransferase family 2 protein [Eubacteriales bacterium]